MAIKVLVTGANSTVAHSVIKALKASSLDVELYGSDINPYSPGLYRVHKAFLIKPFSDPAYEAQMLALLKEHRIDVLLPCVEGELQLLADRRERWEKATGCRIVINQRSLLDITQDKYRTALFLQENGCHFPQSTIDFRPEAIQMFTERLGYPLIVKPRRGATSRDVYIVRSHQELMERIKQVPEPIVQEYLEQEEYTCGAFVDARGVLKGISTLKRTLANGITMTAIVDRFPDVEAEVERVVAALHPIGSCNIQLRRHHGRPTTFEINARFSSSVAIRAHFGFNEAEATIRSFLLDEEVPELPCRTGVAMRYVNEVYVDSSEIQALIHSGQHLPRSSFEGNF